MLVQDNHVRMCDSMKIAICDDIPEFACELRLKVEDICAKMDVPLEAEVFTSPAALLNAELSEIQLVFLDIDMPEKNGLEVAKELRSKYPEVILVFVTAFIEYAPAGYNVAAFRYLLKQEIASTLPAVMEEIQKKLSESREHISVEQRKGTLSIPLKRILYLEGTPYRMVLIHVENNKNPIEAPGKLADYERRLEGKGFLRLQKSFIANMSQISKISSYQVMLKDGTVLKASEKYYRQVHASFLQWKGQHL